jgi:hypothetical protein
LWPENRFDDISVNHRRGRKEVESDTFASWLQRCFSLITAIVGRRSSLLCVLLAAEMVALQLLLRVA